MEETTPKEIILDEINDRSRGGWLMQLIAVLYAPLWFVVKCGARVHFGLATTELEFSTLVLVFLHAIIYLVWWHKPIIVHEAEMRPPERPHNGLESKKQFRDIVPEPVQRYWQEHHWRHFSWFFIVPLLIFSSIFRFLFRLCLVLFFIIFPSDTQPPRPPIHEGIIAGMVPAILYSRRAVVASMRYALDHSVDPTNHLILFLDACIVLPSSVALIPTTIFLFLLTVLVLDPFDAPQGVTLAETSGYIILKTFRRIILATLHFSEKGFLGLVNVPVLCIGFVLLLTLSPFALAITIILHFTNRADFENTYFESAKTRLLISQACKMVMISGAYSAQKYFKSVLKAPDRSQFSVTYYILFIPLILLVTFLFFVAPIFELLILVDRPISSITQTILTDTFIPDVTQVPIFYAPFPKDSRYPCLVAATLIGLTFFGLQCLGWTPPNLNSRITPDFR